MHKSSSHLSAKAIELQRHATWLELFYDLVYVSAIAALSHYFKYNFHIEGFLKFTFLFLPIWWAWSGHTMLANRYDTNDALHKLLTFLQMLAAILMAVFVEEALGPGANNFALAFCCIRFILIFSYLRVFAGLREVNSVIKYVLLGFSVGTCFWIVSLVVAPPFKHMLWAVGLFIDFVTPLFFNKRLKQVPVHSAHLPERLGLFMIIVLGESIVAVVDGVNGIQWHFYSLVAALSGLVLAIGVWWLYFGYIEKYVIGQDLGSGQFYIYWHLPIYLGVVAMSCGLEHLITEGQVGFHEITRLAVCCGLLSVLIPLNIFQVIKAGAAMKKFYVDIFIFLLIFILGFSAHFLSKELFILILPIIMTIYIHYKNFHLETLEA